MIQKYVKKPVEVRAKQYDGTNLDAIKALVGDVLTTTTDSGLPALKARDGVKPLNVSDWVIVNPSGEAYITPAHKFHDRNDHVDGDVYRKKAVKQDVILFDGTEESFKEIAEFGKTVTPPRIAHDYDAEAGDTRSRAWRTRATILSATVKACIRVRRACSPRLTSPSNNPRKARRLRNYRPEAYP